jgi:hypothetical protein
LDAAPAVQNREVVRLAFDESTGVDTAKTMMERTLLFGQIVSDLATPEFMCVLDQVESFLTATTTQEDCGTTRDYLRRVLGSGHIQHKRPAALDRVFVVAMSLRNIPNGIDRRVLVLIGLVVLELMIVDRDAVGWSSECPEESLCAILNNMDVISNPDKWARYLDYWTDMYLLSSSAERPSDVQVAIAIMAKSISAILGEHSSPPTGLSRLGALSRYLQQVNSGRPYCVRAALLLDDEQAYVIASLCKEFDNRKDAADFLSIVLVSFGQFL